MDTESAFGAARRVEQNAVKGFGKIAAEEFSGPHGKFHIRRALKFQVCLQFEEADFIIVVRNNLSLAFHETGDLSRFTSRSGREV